jgi:hypothetical protein
MIHEQPAHAPDGSESPCDCRRAGAHFDQVDPVLIFYRLESETKRCNGLTRQVAGCGISVRRRVKVGWPLKRAFFAR